MVIFIILAIIFFAFFLIKAADMVIVSLRRISHQTKTGVFALSAVVLSLGTTLPELFVGITSAIERHPDLSLGVVLGSNIANLALVGGIAAVAIGKIGVHGDYLKGDVWIALGAGVVPIILVFDGRLGRTDGLILLSLYAAYASSFFRSRYLAIAGEYRKEGFIYRFLRRFNHVDTKKTKEYGRLFIGISLLLFTADMIVKLSETLAILAGIPLFVIGLVILAVGTSLPELVFAIRATEGRQPSMFFGNILGATIANSTLILGVTSLINPIKVNGGFKHVAAVVFFVLIFLTFWRFAKSKQALERREGLFLLALYLVFLVVEFI